MILFKRSEQLLTNDVTMKQLFYKIIYNQTINALIIKINKALLKSNIVGFRVPPTGTLNFEGSKGNQLKIDLNQTCGLGSYIYYDGAHTFEYSEIFIDLIKKVGPLFDVGANIGYYSLLAAAENKSINVVSFEPATGPNFYLNRNKQINKFDNIKIESIALSNKEGELVFYEIKNKKYTYLEHCLAGESNAGSKTKGRNFVPNNVSATTLDQYVKNNDVQSIDLIKIDTEGTEHFILEKSEEVLSRMQPIIICETLFNTIEKELEDIMTKYGYKFYNHTSQGLQQVDTLQREQENGVNNCFFVHPSKYHLIAPYVVS